MLETFSDYNDNKSKEEEEPQFLNKLDTMVNRV